MNLNNLKKATELADQLEDLGVIKDKIETFIESPKNIINDGVRREHIISILADLCDVGNSEDVIARLFKQITERQITKVEQEVIRL